MRSSSYADAINDSKVMLAGLKESTEDLSAWGLNADYISKYETAYTEAMETDNKQEDLKSQLKTITSQVEERVSTMDKFYSNAKKIVKMQLPKDSWKKFGIDDKK